MLGGWSHAGVIAYEMVQQLRSGGDEVALLTLFDTCSPPYLRRFRGLKSGAGPGPIPCRKAPLPFRESAPNEARRRSGIRARERTRTIVLGWKLRFWQFWYRDLKRPAAEHLKYSSNFQYLAVQDYDPVPCGTPMVLFRSQVLQTGWFRDPLLGWGDVAGNGLEVHELAGEHDAMFIEPGVERLAAKLTEALRQLEEASVNEISTATASTNRQRTVSPKS